MMGGQFDVTHQIPLQFIHAGARPRRCCNVQEAKPNFQLMYYGFKTNRPMVADKRVREAMNIAINRAEIVKGIMLGNAEPAYTFVDPEALDFADATKGIIKEDVERAKKLLDEAGWKVGADGIREKDGVKLAPKVYFTQVAYFGRVSRGDPGLHAQDRRRLEDPGLRLDHRARQDGRAGLRALDGDLPLHVGRRPAELLLRFQEHPGAQPDELEGLRRPTSG